MRRIIGLVFVVAVAATAVLQAADAAEIEVGGDFTWRIPSDPSFYSDWATNQNFTLGDVLVFRFAAGGHDVAGVTKEGYDNCNIDHPKFINRTTPFSFSLHKLDHYYFICTVSTHCAHGQKFAIPNINPPSASGLPSTTAVTPPLPPPPPNSVSTLSSTSFSSVAFISLIPLTLIFNH